MAKIIRTLPARDDLLQIWLYVAEHDVGAADRLIDRIDRTVRLLARHPKLGESVPQYRPELRRFTVGNYVIYYEPFESGVRLIRVLHGARKADEQL
jgi:toxin ParE1/3/4